MCVITNKTDNHVVSISLIPGILDSRVFDLYHIYFPVPNNNLPQIGDTWIGKPEWLVNKN